MSATLARSIRRIDLLPSTKDEKGMRVHNYSGLTFELIAAAALLIRDEAVRSRQRMREAQRKDRAAHKSRVAKLHKK